MVFPQKPKSVLGFDAVGGGRGVTRSSKNLNGSQHRRSFRPPDFFRRLRYAAIQPFLTLAVYTPNPLETPPPCGVHSVGSYNTNISKPRAHPANFRQCLASATFNGSFKNVEIPLRARERKKGLASLMSFHFRSNHERIMCGRSETDRVRIGSWTGPVAPIFTMADIQHDRDFRSTTRSNTTNDAEYCFALYIIVIP
jgi:hypothetical protein